MSWAQLQRQFPWPDQRPKIKPYIHGPRVHERCWYEMLGELVSPVFVEVGAWTGKTSHWLLDRFPSLRLIVLDLWDAVHYRFVREMHAQFVAEGRIAPATSLADLYRANLWDSRARVVVIHDESVAGLRAVVAAGIRPAVAYIDAAHDYKHVLGDIETAVDLLPASIICGDDYLLDGVHRAVHEIADARGFAIRVFGKGFWRYG